MHPRPEKCVTSREVALYMGQILCYVSFLTLSGQGHLHILGKKPDWHLVRSATELHQVLCTYKSTKGNNILMCLISNNYILMSHMTVTCQKCWYLCECRSPLCIRNRN